MKLHVENCPEHERWLSKAFEVCTKELGIAEAKGWTVNVRLDPALIPYDCGGCTSFDRKHPKAALISLRPDNHMEHGGGTYSMPEVFCHELIHVKQHVKDGLAGDNRHNGTWWRGRFYPGELEDIANNMPTGHERRAAYRDVVPWEYEAYTKMMPLAEKVYPQVRPLFPKGK